MGILREYIPFIIPLLVIQLGLAIAALIHILRHKEYRFGNRPLWIVVCLLFSIIGPVLYFTLGKGDE